jgi:sugar phosphate isomerase/epimerase
MEHRAESLVRSLKVLAAAAPSESFICVENMPRGVWPGSEMGDLARIVDRVGRKEVALIVDTGHAAIVEDAASQTRKAGARLASTHVHDNDGKQDSHRIPGSGVVDWGSWIAALDEIGYGGPVMLECIRDLRDRDEAELERLGEEIRGMLRAG